MSEYTNLKGLDAPSLDALVKMMVWMVYADADESLSESKSVVRAAGKLGWQHENPASAVLHWSEELPSLNDEQIQEGCRQLAQRLPLKAQRLDAFALCLDVVRADGRILPAESLLMNWLAEAFDLSDDERHEF